MIETIGFTAQVAKVSTLADGGIRVTLDLPETAIDTATKLMQVKQRGGLLEVAAIAVVKQESIKNDICTRSEWKPEGTT